MENKKHFGIMIDNSRNGVMTIPRLKTMADYLVKMGYNTLMLYTEDTYEVKDEPYFGYLRGRYSIDEIKDLDSYCNSIGISLIPCIQTLAHLNQIFRWAEYSKINDINDILMADDQRTYELIDNMFRSLSEAYTTRTVNIGMDEAHMVGLGKYFDKHGLKNRFDILHRHIEKVLEIADKYGFTCMMWSDMFFRLATKGGYYARNVQIPDEAKNAVPDNINLIYWDYYHTEKEDYNGMIDGHTDMVGKDRVWFGGGAWTWIGFTPQNGYTLKSMVPAMECCKEKGIDNIFLTMWGDDGNECSPFAVLPSLFYVKKVYDGETDEEKIKKEFKDIFGIDFDAFMLLDCPDNIWDGEGRNVNPSRYLLYNDLFLGKMDSSIREGTANQFKECSEKLAPYTKSGEFSYLFATAKALCDVLSVKAELGIKLRTAYKAGDRETLRKLVSEIDKCEDLTEEFYYTFRDSWYFDRKPHGFDVQDIRLGGLMRRLHSCSEILTSYLDGDIDAVPELSEDILDCFCGTHENEKDIIYYQDYKATATQNII